MIAAGRIELIVGPMFAGKTTELLRRIERAEIAKKKCCVMKYSKDTRYSAQNVSTHDLHMRTAIPCPVLMPTYNEASLYDVIGIDEGQFFPDVVEFSEKLANEGKIVIVAGLDGDFMRKPFGRVLELISKCESITKLTAVCTETGGDACFTQRLVDSKELELIGGNDMYRAASRSSFHHINTSGEINLTIGPVHSGKTTEIIRVLNRHYIANRSVLLITPIESKQFLREPKFDVLRTNDLPPIEFLEKYQIIGVDDGHMYNELSLWSDSLANSGKLVVITAMESQPSNQPYHEIIKTFSLSEKVQKLDSVCPITGLPASFNCLFGLELLPLSRLALMQKMMNAINIA